MTVECMIDGQSYRIDFRQGRSIAIPLRFGGAQPNSYDVPAANARAYEDGVFIGDTRRGGSCNFDVVTLIPHCNGTHTECVGHISRERISIEQILQPALSPATLLSVTPVDARSSGEHYEPAADDGDLFITADSIRKGLLATPVTTENQRESSGTETVASASIDAKQIPAGGESRTRAAQAAPALGSEFMQALILRTTPNTTEKISRRYTTDAAPFFSLEAIDLIRTMGVRHLLVDIPSLDRAFDQGIMAAHHLFWDVPYGSNDVPNAQASPATVTEMIFVPDDIPDGCYILDIQIAAFVSDAAPSRPILYPLTLT
ncbi:MAG: cyclase family protein [Bacteroidetes bacterium]|nr:cyclase family protein [Bacteroidota bacterium]